jgi:FKBP-type peptidyl-prolyl cis-trans isomerase FklB
MSLFDKLNQSKGEKLAANLKAGEDFLEKNKQREGVQTTSSRLQYEVLAEGDGTKPKATDKVKCHYHGTLIDGTIFDSSVQRGQPATFPLNMVIKGWTEALQLMSVGSKYRLFLHPSLAYGERQTGAVIGPNSTLIFDVELLGIE